MAEPPPPVNLPTDLTGAAAGTTDIAQPIVRLAGQLNLLPDPTDLKSAGGISAAFTGPPDSVAVIEAGATALTKWWAAGLGAVVVAAWGSVGHFWNDNTANQHQILWAAAIVTAASLLGICYIISSDIRGRAAGTVATIEARASIAASIEKLIAATNAPPPASPAAGTIIAVSPHLNATSLEGADSPGWKVVAALTNGDAITKYLIVKDGDSKWSDAANVQFV